MKVFELLVALITGIAWPLLIGLVLIYYRDDVRQFMAGMASHFARTKRLKFAGAELEIEPQTREEISERVAADIDDQDIVTGAGGQFRKSIDDDKRVDFQRLELLALKKFESDHIGELQRSLRVSGVPVDGLMVGDEFARLIEIKFVSQSTNVKKMSDQLISYVIRSISKLDADNFGDFRVCIVFVHADDFDLEKSKIMGLVNDLMDTYPLQVHLYSYSYSEIGA